MVKSTDILIRTADALSRNFFTVRILPSKEALAGAVRGLVKPGLKVGLGGSVTVREAGLPEILKDSGVNLLDHWEPGLSKEDIQTIRIGQLTCDLFISGANALTEQGMVVNIDSVGNRVNSLVFGPGRALIVAGYNKIVPDLEAALERIRTVAAPLNAKRLNLPLPCAASGICQDCSSEQRICRIISILQKRPAQSDVSVFLVDEKLGY